VPPLLAKPAGERCQREAEISQQTRMGNPGCGQNGSNPAIVVCLFRLASTPRRHPGRGLAQAPTRSSQAKRTTGPSIAAARWDCGCWPCWVPCRF
jgi:hypothetical protein